MAALIVVFCLGLAVTALSFNSSGVAVFVYSLTIVALAVAAVGLSPPLFFRFPAWGRVGAYVIGLVAFIAVIWTFNIAHTAYERTPKGAAEAAALKAEEAAQADLARQEARLQASLAVAEEAERSLAETRSRVQRCINWRGQIPSLVRIVKDGMHNPRSFHHVRTEMRVVGTTGVPAVVMQYRGENAFGAIRTETVSAFIAPDDCSVRAVKEYEPSDFAD
ncbi:MAG: hypothetical protein K1X67_07330 [Fimbriimonadaceae bacterium]|nr:hypothetical protein [Fimbriimonadaceae bacterium]